jgi:hypothetical protein
MTQYIVQAADAGKMLYFVSANAQACTAGMKFIVSVGGGVPGAGVGGGGLAGPSTGGGVGGTGVRPTAGVGASPTVGAGGMTAAALTTDPVAPKPSYLGGAAGTTNGAKSSYMPHQQLFTVLFASLLYFSIIFI